MTALSSAEPASVVWGPVSRRPNPFVARRRLPWLFALFLLCVSALSALYIYSGCCIVFREPIRADGYGYYAYLPAFFIDHDLTMKTALAYRWTVVTKPLGYIWYGIAPYIPTGNLLDKYTLGTALLQSPSFLAAQAIAGKLGLAPYSAPYQAASVIWSDLFLGAGGFLLLRNLLGRHCASTSLLAACAVIFGTSVFHFAVYFSSYSHVYSFFLFALLLMVTDAYRTRGATSAGALVGIAAGLGAILGLIALTRVPNVIVGLVPLALIGERFRRIRRLKTAALEIAALVSAALLLFAPQIAYWHAVTGHYFLNSYQSEDFDWVHPQLTNFLFSVRKGLFFWTPILLIAMIGLPRFAQTQRVYAVAVCVVLALEIYICSSWWAWWFGESFGVRPITDMMPLMALPLACGLDWMREKAGAFITVSVVTVLVALNLFLMLSYWREFFPWDRHTLADLSRLPQKWETVPLLKPETSRALILATLGSYTPGTPFLAREPPPRGMWIEGIDKPAPAVWTVGNVATVFIRPDLPPKGDLRLIVTLASPGAMLSGRHPSQRAIIKLNGATIGAITAAYPRPGMRWSFVLPRRLFRSGEIARIEFDLPDAAAPSRLGINSDPRLLGLYLSRIDILPAEML